MTAIFTINEYSAIYGASTSEPDDLSSGSFLLQ
jgi:hypothetical protein